MIKIALVDDHQLFRKSLSLLLNSSDAFEIVYDSDDGLHFIAYAQSNVIDVVLLDIQMPKLNGFEVCKRLKVINPEIKILIISQLTSKEVIHYVMECGANGFCSKNTSPEHLEIAIHKIMEHDYYFDTNLGSIIRDVILWDKKEVGNFDPNSSLFLTKREIEIIKLSCKEMITKEIANKLCVSPRTVDNHKKNIMKKTNAKNFIGVVLFAIKINAISFEDL
ncbi:response regulator [Flavobacterium sp.]|jgi:DNA-binding NarL/FixJ family response regulator|uniref:response regulator n=1 Tax=Flavobacterium sp. TaxID=239 RepID=UPI0037BEC0CE